jgi:CRP-like cAMP-binding protein
MNDQHLQELISLQRDTVGLLALLVKRGATQPDLIKELNSIGFTPKRIAELLDTTANTVSVSLNKMKRLKKK